MSVKECIPVNMRYSMMTDVVVVLPLQSYGMKGGIRILPIALMMIYKQYYVIAAKYILSGKRNILI